jgi:hypothetical protein
MGDGSFFIGLIMIIIFIWFYLIKKEKTAPTRYETQPKQYGVASYTQMGTPVRSHTERFIADYFTKNNIRYEYEPVVMGGNYDNKTIHPDFYLPDHDIYVEYWGLVDVPDQRLREQYVRSMRWKMAQYHSRNMKFISIYPYNMNNFEYVFPRKFEELTGSKLISYPSSLNSTNLPDGSMVSCRYCNGIIRKGEPYCGYCGKENP